MFTIAPTSATARSLERNRIKEIVHCRDAEAQRNNPVSAGAALTVPKIH
jgi:hypothetical protein